MASTALLHSEPDAVGGAPQGAPQGVSLLVCCLGGSRLDDAWPSRRWPQSESVILVLDALRRRGGSRQSVSWQGLRVSRYGSRVTARGQCPRGHGLGAVHAPGACFWEKGQGPVAQPAAAVRRAADSCPLVSGLRACLHLWMSVLLAAPFFTVLPLSACSCLIPPCY